jgi:hypothetical protein
MKLRPPSSALIRNSSEWPRVFRVVVAELFACVDAEHLADHVDSGDLLGDAVLDLKADVDLRGKDMLPPGDQELARPGADGSTARRSFVIAAASGAPKRWCTCDAWGRLSRRPWWPRSTWSGPAHSEAISCPSFRRCVGDREALRDVTTLPKPRLVAIASTGSVARSSN